MITRTPVGTLPRLGGFSARLRMGPRRTRVAVFCAAVVTLCGCSESRSPQEPTPSPVASVLVSPTELSLVLGQTQPQQLTATIRDQAGNALVGRSVAWATTAPSVA